MRGTTYAFVEFQNVNSVDPDQTSHSAASDLGLHCLHLSPIRFLV